MPTGLSGWRDYFNVTEPWCRDHPKMRTYMAAALHYEQQGDSGKAEKFLNKAITVESQTAN